MQILKPFYYDEFKCIANKCKDSCCIGWGVCIDKRSFNRYKKVKGPFAKTLNDNISRDRASNHDYNYGKMNLENEKCPFLNEEKFCDLYINLGEDYLCNTCKMYPRKIHMYTDIYERTLNLSCPEVARLLIRSKEPFGFNIVEENVSQVDKECMVNINHNKQIANLLWEGRSLFIDIAQFREIPLWKRIVFIKLAEQEIQNIINSSEYDKVESLINGLRKGLMDEECIASLDDIKESGKIKTLFANMIIETRCNLGSCNDTFVKLMEEFNTLIGNIEDETCFEKLQTKEEAFDKYFKEKEYILENYIVYTLYNNCMRTIYTKNLNKEIVRLIIGYAVIKKLLVARWNTNEQKLEDEDIIDVLYSFARVLEHNENLVEYIYKSLKENGYDTLAYLTILVR